MSGNTFGPIELLLFLGTPLLLSLTALGHHLWTERRDARRPTDARIGTQSGPGPPSQTAPPPHSRENP